MTNNNITSTVFSENANKALVRPIFWKKEHGKLKTYRHVSILHYFSKIYKNSHLEIFKPFINSFLTKYIIAYTENYTTNTILMDLSKAFDCIPHDPVIAKLYAFGLTQ